MTFPFKFVAKKRDIYDKYGKEGLNGGGGGMSVGFPSLPCGGEDLTAEVLTGGGGQFVSSLGQSCFSR